ncbi:MAG: DEAD/DEAH box helicase [Clostridiales bacterium]|nr:DEAD/DEAH box helicase [Clostridiales bacterium]
MSNIKFTELPLLPELQRAVQSMGFTEATPIQSQSIPVILEGRDVIGHAQTGTGKTASFGLPLLQKIDPASKKLQAIVLCPTRELAIQAATEIRNLAKYLHSIKVLPIYGGQDMGRQIRSLKGGVQVVIGTPGRVMDHMRRRTLKMADLHTVVLDEADEMLNMGFREDIETILKQIPQEHQTILFSATMPRPIMEITKNYQKDAKLIRITRKELVVPNIKQYYYQVKPQTKEEALSSLLKHYSPKRSVVFCNTKRQVDSLVNVMISKGYSAAGIHGDLKQKQRDYVMKNFRSGKTSMLIATDVAARGIDVDDIEAVFNFDLPLDNEYYVHRIGRTGRAGRKGRSFTFVNRREMYKLKEIQRYCKTKISERKLPA